MKEMNTHKVKNLKAINDKEGIHIPDEAVYDMGVRLLGLAEVALGEKRKDDKSLEGVLTETEREAFEFLRKKFGDTGRVASSRELSQALGYKSSRSGYLLLQSLQTKGFLIEVGNHLTFPKDRKGKFGGATDNAPSERE